MRYKFIINGNAGNGQVKNHIESILNVIKNNFSSFEYSVTEKLSDLDHCLNSLSNIDSVIAVGGDGTINGIVNKIIDKDILFGIIPLGSGNDFIHALQIPHNLQKSIEIIKRNRIKTIDTGLIETEKYTKYFVNAVGIGFDAMVGFNTNRIKFIKGGSKYYIALIKSLFTYKPQRLHIKIDSLEISKRPFLFTIGNGQRTGGAFILTPGALLDDGLFEICIADNVSIPTVIAALPKVLKGAHGSMKQIEFEKAKTVEINSDYDLFVHYDGETPCLVKNINVSISKYKLNILQ